MQTPPSKKRESGALVEVWRAHNALLDYVRAIAVQQSGSQGVRVTQTSNGTLLKVQVATTETETASIARFRVESENNDTLSCRQYDGSTLGSETVLVAKAFQHRLTPFAQPVTMDDGSIFTYSYQSPHRRTKSNGTTTETQELTPEFNLGFDEIFAANIPGETGVSGVDWVDMNLDGRAWARV